MSRKSRRQARDFAREQEFLHAPVNPTGVGEDPVIKALFQKLAYATSEEAVEIALQLQKLVRGPASMLDDPEQSDALNRIRAEASAHDAATHKYEENQAKFVEDEWDKAQSLLPPEGPARDKLRATGAQITEKAMQHAAIIEANHRQRLDYELKYGPTETITVTGQMTMVRQGESMKMIVEPVTIGLHHRVFKLGPGTYDVPAPIAALYRNRVRGQAQVAEMEAAMAPREGAEGMDTAMVGRLNEISRRYKSPMELIPTVGVR